MEAGLVANSQWYAHLTIAQALSTIQPYFILRAVGGGIVVVSAFLFAINIAATFLSKHLVHPKTVENYGDEEKDE
jgi:cytochrome c oxidase cbb3-type subunit I/II